MPQLILRLLHVFTIARNHEAERLRGFSLGVLLAVNGLDVVGVDGLIRGKTVP